MKSTARKLTEHKLHYLEEEFLNLLRTDISVFDFIQNHLFDGLWYWDLENIEHEWMNAKFWQTLGYDPEEMNHSPLAWQDKIFKDDLELAKNALHRHLQDPDSFYDLIVRYLHQNGSTVWIRCYGRAIWKDGRPVRMLGAHQDITAIQGFDQLKEANKALNAKKRELDRVLEITKVGTWYLDLETNEVSWSQELYKMYGLDPSVPAPAYTEQKDWYNPESWKVLTESVQKALDVGVPYELELGFIRSDGSNGWMRVRGEQVLSNGRVSGLWGVARDVTDEVIKRNQLKELSDTREKLATIGTLASGIAHEINNPNQMILSSAQFLESCMREMGQLIENLPENELNQEIMGIPVRELPEHMNQSVTNIKQGSNRIATIVSEIKNYVRKSSYHVTSLDINKVIYSAQTLTAPWGKKKTDHFDWFPGRDLMVLGNFQRLEQVMMNLLMNAYESLSNKSESVTVESFKEGNCVVVKITDQGVGIPAEVADRIMDPFFSTKQDKGGTGMGLSIVSKILEEHNASIKFEKNEPKGTVVRLKFPLLENEISQ